MFHGSSKKGTLKYKCSGCSTGSTPTWRWATSSLITARQLSLTTCLELKTSTRLKSLHLWGIYRCFSHGAMLISVATSSESICPPLLLRQRVSNQQIEWTVRDSKDTLNYCSGIYKCLIWMWVSLKVLGSWSVRRLIVEWFRDWVCLFPSQK